jgi:hypothetical protein
MRRKRLVGLIVAGREQCAGDVVIVECVATDPAGTDDLHVCNVRIYGDGAGRMVLDPGVGEMGRPVESDV